MNIILDTDIGVDCDDAVALALLLNLEKAKECRLVGITTSTTRTGATATVKAILNFYGVEKPLGRMYQPVLECDGTNNYAREVMELYGFTDCEKESGELLLELLEKSAEPITIVAIGPLSNIRNAMLAVTASGKKGIDIIAEKVEAMYCMGGCFNRERHIAEWNIAQDIQAARYVIGQFPSKIFFSPLELGEKIFTGSVFRKETTNPVRDCIRLFGEKNANFFSLERFARESWDPVTCYAAVFPQSPLISSGESGRAEVGADGVTQFTECQGGKHFVLSSNGSPKELSKVIDNLCSPDSI